MVQIIDGGDLPKWPDTPAVYIFVCAFPGDSDHRLGAILYIGASGIPRRRIGYALGVQGKGAPHGTQRPLLELQKKGGVARVLICPSGEGVDEDDLERALLVEYRRRVGNLPVWNRVGRGKALVSDQGHARAGAILDALGVRGLTDG